MLQIKNTLGGGKPEGLYVWKKYEIGTSYIEKTTQHEAQSNGIVITKGLTFNSNMTVKVTRATSYTFDSATGKYTLKNNISSFDVVSGVASGSTSYSTALNGYYFMLGDDTEADYMYKGCDSYSIGFTNNGDGTCKMWEQYVGNPIYAYSADTEPTYTFLDYIVSDKENAYPDGGEKGGYWYEKVGGFLTGTITQTTKNKTTLSFEYGSNKTPKAFYLMHMGEVNSGNVKYLVYSTWYDESQGLNNGAYAYYNSPYVYYTQGTGGATCSATFSDGVVTLGGNNYYYGTYLWVAIF